MFHAAQAATREAFGAAPKTHSGLIARFGDLCRREAGLGPELGRRLARGYQVKDTADYGSVEEARQLKAAEILS